MRHAVRAAMASVLLLTAVVCGSADDEGTLRLPGLQWPSIGEQADAQPTERPVGAAQVSWSSLGEFSSVAVTDSVPYGALSLTARHVFDAAAVEVPARVEWRLNASQAPVSVGESVIYPGDSVLDNSVSGSDGPLPAGHYEATFIINGVLTAVGGTTIVPPPPLGGREPADVYAAALQTMVGALDAYAAEDLQKAGTLAAQAVPSIGTAMQVSPQLPDIIAVSEAAHALIALQKTDAAVQAEDITLAAEWATRAASHANVADGLTEDEQFKAWISRLAQDTLGLLELLLEVLTEAQG